MPVFFWNIPRHHHWGWRSSERWTRMHLEDISGVYPTIWLETTMAERDLTPDRPMPAAVWRELAPRIEADRPALERAWLQKLHQTGELRLETRDGEVRVCIDVDSGFASNSAMPRSVTIAAGLPEEVTLRLDPHRMLAIHDETRLRPGGGGVFQESMPMVG